MEDIQKLVEEKKKLEELVIELTKENMYYKKKFKKISEINENPIIFSDWMLDWLNRKKFQIKENTYNAYHSQIHNHIIPYFSSRNLKLVEITPEILENYYYFKISNGLTANTVCKHHSNLHAALKKAVKNRLLTNNPADLVDKPTIKKYTGKILSSYQVNLILTKLQGTSIFLPVAIASYMGLRRSEVLGLHWKDIDWANRTMLIQHTIVKSNKKVSYELIESNIPKNKSSHRTLPIPESLYNLLLLHKKKQIDLYIKNRLTYDKKYLKYVCVDKYGIIIKPDSLSNQFKAFIKKQNIDLRFHDLRHTCASLLIQNGTPLKQVSQWLGHSNINITSETYVHLIFKDKIAIANTINDTFNLA